MSDKRKKLLIVTSGGILALVLIIAIAVQFGIDSPARDVPPSSNAADSKITTEPEVSVPDQTKKDITVQSGDMESKAPVDTTPPQTDQSEQKIQPDVSKPKAPEKPKVADNADITNPKQPSKYSPKDTKKESVESTPTGGLPGFDNVPDGGANQGSYVDDMYENGNKIGEMN